MTAKEHAKLLGLFFWIYAGIQLFVIGFSGVMMFLWTGIMFSEFSRHSSAQHSANFPQFFGMMGVIMVFAVFMGLILLIPKFVAGYGLRKDKSWAKVWAIIGCCLAVLNAPLGTALGIYGFWFIFGDLGKEYFDGPQIDNVPNPPPPQSWQ
ncbi:MAG: hypothetical protein R2747_05460 [Pyrinomonadaceae bacterium]